MTVCLFETWLLSYQPMHTITVINHKIRLTTFLLDTPALCCDAEQVENMDQSLLPMDQMFARCPTCVKNVVRHICELSCSPNQSQFFKATATEVNDEMEERGKRFLI